jgi:uncharacterized membrane protein
VVVGMVVLVKESFDGGFVVIVFLCVGVANDKFCYCEKVFGGVCAADGNELQ